MRFQESRLPSRPTPRFSMLLAEPLRGVVAPGSPRAPREGGVSDTHRARKWFDLLRWGVAEDLYTYQQPLTGRAGSRIKTGGRSLLMLSSYDYLGLIGHPAMDRAAIRAVRQYGTGTGGVRLLTGTARLHRELEDRLAVFQQTEAALTVSSGYFANLAAITALVGPEDMVFVDALSHRSIVDGCRLARVPVRSFRHNDPEDLEEQLRRAPTHRRALVVIEGIYSMDGDIGALPDFVDVKRRHGAFLLVDEAHSIGVLGVSGRGVDEHFHMAAKHVDVWTGSLSKALASNGGYVAGSRELIVYLQHEAAPFVFSAALCPAATAAAQAAIDILGSEPGRIRTLADNAMTMRDGLRDLGVVVDESSSPVIPVVVGHEVAAYRLARSLWRLGVMATAIVYPAVPRGQARLRLCVTAAHRAHDLDEALSALRIAMEGSRNDRAISVA